MDKQTTAAFVLIGLILVMWLYFNSPTPQPQTPKNADSTQVQKDTITQKPVVEKKVEESKPVEPKEEEIQTGPFVATNSSENIITVETDLARIELTSKGARIRRYFLKKYKTWYHNQVTDTAYYNQDVQLVNTNKNGGDFNILFATKNGKVVNTSTLNFTTSSNNFYYKISGKDSLTIQYKFTADDNKSIVKTYEFFGDNYASNIDIKLENMQDLISGYRYDVIWADGINFVEKNSVDEAQHANASVYSGDEQTIIDASGDEKVSKDINGRVDWIAERNKYFAMILSPDKPTEDGGAYFEGYRVKKGEDIREYYSSSLKMPFRGTNFQEDSFKLYIGPIDYGILKSYGREFQNVFEFGSFLGLKFLIRPLSEFILLPFRIEFI